MFTDVNENFIKANQKAFMDDDNKNFKYKLSCVHPSSTPHLENKVIKNNIVDTKYCDNDQKMKESLIESRNQFETKISNRLVDIFISSSCYGHGHYKTTHTTPMFTNKNPTKTTKTFGETKKQDPHRDFKWKQLDVSTKQGRRKCRFICFMPMTKEGMVVTVWPEHSYDKDANLIGKVVFIPYGYALLLREDVVHAGGLLTKTNNDSGNARLHFYVIYEKYDRNDSNNNRTTRSKGSAIDQEVNQYTFPDKKKPDHFHYYRNSVVPVYQHPLNIDGYVFEVPPDLYHHFTSSKYITKNLAD
jgi:hypothetical protein